MNARSRFVQFLMLVDIANNFTQSSASWGLKYVAIFNEEVSEKILSLEVGFEVPYLGGRDEEDSVRIYMAALNEKADDVRKLLERE